VRWDINIEVEIRWKGIRAKEELYALIEDEDSS
jgi:hypothetical protein